jgi:hypothetical protein
VRERALVVLVLVSLGAQREEVIGLVRDVVGASRARDGQENEREQDDDEAFQTSATLRPSRLPEQAALPSPAIARAPLRWAC